MSKEKEEITRREFLLGMVATAAGGFAVGRFGEPTQSEPGVAQAAESLPAVQIKEAQEAVIKTPDFYCLDGTITGFNQMTDKQIGQFDRQQSQVWTFWNSWQKKGHISGDRINSENKRGIALEVGVDADRNIHVFTRIVDSQSPNNGAILLPKSEDGNINPKLNPNDLDKDLGDPIYLLPQTKNGWIFYSCQHSGFVSEEKGEITHVYNSKENVWEKVN